VPHLVVAAHHRRVNRSNGGLDLCRFSRRDAALWIKFPPLSPQRSFSYPEGGPFVDRAENPTAVLLDRHPLWHEAVEHVLQRVGVRVVGKTSSPPDALALIEIEQPNLFVTGITMQEGDMDGLECVRQAREHVPHLRTVVLSMHSDKEHVDAALEAGAFAYVIKSAHPDDLAAAVRQAFEHSLFLASSTQPARAWSDHARGDVPDLTRREREILQLMAQGHSNAQLAKMLWVTEQTVKFHLSNIYRKLNVSNRTEAAHWAQVRGLLDAPIGPVPLSA
jgi:two-component system, NarL family, response regulator DevR